MKKLFKLTITLLFIITIAFIGVISDANTDIKVYLEMQENTDLTAIRYISTIENLYDLDDISRIDVDITVTNGIDEIHTAIPLNDVYTSVSGEKASKDNTYYAVLTLTNIDSYSGYTISTYFSYVLPDESTIATNTKVYTIAADYIYTDGNLGYANILTIDNANVDNLGTKALSENTIFHAWNWSIAEVSEHLDEIKEAGFTAVQLSPLQPQKDYIPNNTVYDAWWKLYQPLGFSIATHDNQLGTKDELIELINQNADENFTFIVDVVANHLAGTNTTLDPAVALYEPEIYGTDGTYAGGAKLHNNNGASATDSSTSSIVNNSIGMPDLDTEDAVVVERIKALLAEYAECGVYSFRFDAAKHIATSSDSISGSLDEIVNSAYDNALNDSAYSYIYGEILSPVGNDRSYSYYTDFMNITDNVASTRLREAIINHNAAAACNYIYPTGEDASSLLLWAESHDDYAGSNSYSTNISINDIHKTYAIAASRADTAILYFARPTDGEYTKTSCTTILGDVGSMAFKDIAPINYFRNYWYGSAEYLTYYDSFVMNVRYDSSDSGLILVNVGDDNSSINIPAPEHLRDGIYYDTMNSNSQFTVGYDSLAGKRMLKGTLGSSSILCLASAKAMGEPSISTSASLEFSADTMTATFSLANMDSCTATIDGVTYPAYDGAMLTIGANMEINDTFEIVFNAIYDTDKEYSKSFIFKKVVEASPTEKRIYFKNNTPWDDEIYIYLWKQELNNGWKNVTMNYNSLLDIYYYDVISDMYENVIFADANNQTIDLELSSLYNCYELKSINGDGKYTVTASSYCEHIYGDPIVIPATHLAKGSQTYTCTKCGHSYVNELDIILHDDDLSWTKTSDKHYHECSCGAILDEASHIFDDGDIIIPATEDNDGLTKYTCSICGYVYEKVIPKTTHVHSYNETVTAPDCTHQGYTTYTCSCGDEYIDDYVDALEHNSSVSYIWSDDNTFVTAILSCTRCNIELKREVALVARNVIISPLCDADGEGVYIASFSEFAEVEKEFVIDALGHDYIYIKQNEVVPGCLDSGHYDIYRGCHNCELNEFVNTIYIDALGHKWEYSSSIAPTRSAAGKIIYICSHADCEATYELPIPALGTTRVYFTNNWHWDNVYAYIWGGANTTSWPGAKMTYSHKNGDNDDVYYIDVADNTMIIFNNGSGTQTIDITIDKENTNAYYLSGGSGTSVTVGTWTYYTKTLMCDEHTFIENEIIPSTEDNTGLAEYVCSVCGYKEEKILPKLGHSHNYSAEYYYNDTYHFLLCDECDNKANIAKHNLITGYKNGKYIISCSDCSYIDSLDVSALRIHYNRPDDNYGVLNSLYIWADGLDGASYKMVSSDSFGLYYEFSLALFDGIDELGVIVKNEGSTWDNRDGNENKYIIINECGYADGCLNAYIVSGTSEVYTSLEQSEKANIKSFKVSKEGSNYYLKAEMESAPSGWKIYKNGSLLFSSSASSKIINEKLGSSFPNLSDTYELAASFPHGDVKAVANMWDLYDLAEFEALYSYDKELGAIYSNTSTTFKVWSPVASKMYLNLYPTGTPAALFGLEYYPSVEYNNGRPNLGIEMQKADSGVWTYSINADLSGIYYTYDALIYGTLNKNIVDPYAKATGVNGLRGMVVNPSLANPEGWEEKDSLYYNPASLVVYETHIADLTSSETWGGPASLAKTFKGFALEGTSYTSGGTTVTTGFDHIKELGVNAVELIPVFDAANDELNPAFNWGYNPLNYFTPDGIYATNPYDGYSALREFKELVMAYNNAGIEIIQDVVFNHVNNAQTSSFNLLAPGYYYRYSNGYMSDGSGCGNETASERYMFRKLMLDCTEYWVNELGISGFRFDLMGCHDIETMTEIADNLQQINANIVVYGEPWSAASCATSEPLCTEANLSNFDGFGCFNSSLRDALIAGGMAQKTDTAWVTNNKSTYDNYWKVQDGLMGFMSGGSTIITDVNATVAYASCHDNYTLYDRIINTGASEADAKKMAMLANSVVLTSQGITFILSGEEFLRTKNGNGNSYNASYELNALDYSRKITYSDMVDNYKKLISLKTSNTCLSLSQEECEYLRNHLSSSEDKGMLYFTVDDYIIIHNNGLSTHNLDLSNYYVYLDTLGIYESNTALSSYTAISKYQTIIAYKNQ